MVVSLSSPLLVVREDGLVCRLHLVGAPVSPGRPTFVLVHGIGMSHRYLRRLAAALAPNGHVRLIDLPGFGGNATPAHPLSVESFATPIAHALDVAGMSSCVLPGRSMGAQLVADSLLEPPSANAIVFAADRRCGPRWYFAPWPAMLSYPIEKRRRLVEQPVLVLCGSRHPIARAA